MKYRTAPEVKEVAESLIEEVEDLEYLTGEPLVYVMMSEAPKKSGRIVLGRAKKVSGLAAFLAARPRPEAFKDPAPPDLLVVEVSEFWWRSMPPAGQRGLVDHLLNHFDYDADTGVFRVLAPEFGEFPGVLERHGFWRPDTKLRDFAASMSEQLSLLPPEERVIAGMDPEFREQLESGQVSIESELNL